MGQDKKSIIIKIIIVVFIIVAISILGTIIASIVTLNRETSTSGNTEQSNLQIETPTTNTEENITNEEENEVIVPIINGTGEQVAVNNNQQKQLLSTSYYYNQLNNDAKIIYDNLKKNKDKLITGTYVFDFNTQFNTLLHSQTGEQQLNEAFQSAWNAFSYDESDLFYIDVSKMTLLRESRSIGGITTHYVSIGPGENTNYLKEQFQTQEQITTAQAYLDNIVTQIVGQTRQNTDVEKVKRIHDWLISIIEYDDSNTNQNRFHIYGALYDKKAVCEGYARSFKYLLEKVGVSCVLVSGTATNSEERTEEHAWNYVHINNIWYAVDITWDDPVVIGGGEVSNQSKYRYFLKGSEKFMRDHSEDGVISENSIEFQFPTLSVSDYEEY